MSVARNIIKNPKLVPGGGATELTVSATLKQKSSSIEGIEKVKQFPNGALYSAIFELWRGTCACAHTKSSLFLREKKIVAFFSMI